jgi:hypothetical protein
MGTDLNPASFAAIIRLRSKPRCVNGQRHTATRPKPNIRVTRGKVDGYAAIASVGSIGRRVFMSRWKIPYGLTWP